MGRLGKRNVIRLLAVLCAFSTAWLAAPLTSHATAEPVQLIIRPITDTFPSIDSTTVRMDVVFDGSVTRSGVARDVRGARIRVDITRDVEGARRAMTLAGSALALIVDDAEVRRLALRQIEVYGLGGAQYVNMVGGANICLKSATPDSDLVQFQDQLTPNALFGSHGLEDRATITARAMGVETINGVRAQRYEVSEASSVSSFDRMVVWVAVRGGYVVKIMGESRAARGDTYNLIENFSGTYRLTYSIVSVNRGSNFRLPKACERAITA
jgi:hypothetical protein